MPEIRGLNDGRGKTPAAAGLGQGNDFLRRGGCVTVRRERNESPLPWQAGVPKSADARQTLPLSDMGRAKQAHAEANTYPPFPR